MTYYYICDRCGNLTNITDEPIPDDPQFICDRCESPALWEFTNKSHALQHQAHIQRLHRSGLLRGTR